MTPRAIVIGAGAAGLTVAVGLTVLGKTVALVERGAVGGDCTNVGCIPSKTLIHLAREGRLEPAEVLRGVRAKRDHLRDEETAWVEGIAGLELVRGHARLVAPGRVEVALEGGGTRRLHAGAVVLATGSRPKLASLPGLPEARRLSNETLFELAAPPRHLLILGAGVVATEMAFAFRRLGSQVTVVGRSARVLPRAPASASALMARRLQAEGVALFLQAEASAYDESKATLTFLQAGTPGRAEGVDKVLMAVGRRANLDGLGLETLGLAWNEDGLVTSAFGETAVRGLYAVGDANARSRFTHSAGAQGRRALRRIAFPWLPAWGREPLYPSVVFGEPEVATVGLDDAALARLHPGGLLTLRAELAKTDRGYTEGLAEGFIELTVRRLSGRLLRAVVVAPRAGETISFFTLAIARGVSLYRLFALVQPYPTYMSALQDLADDFMKTTLPALPRELGAYLRYRWRRR